MEIFDTKQYMDSALKLKTIRHEINYEFNPTYRKYFDLMNQCMKSLWAGFTVENYLKYDGFINVQNK